MVLSWLTLLPPAFVIISVLITHRIHASLILGIATACLVASQGALQPAWQLGSTGIYNTISNPENINLYGFLILIGILIVLFSATGYATACAFAITSKIRTAVSAQYSAMVVSAFLFLDDYLSILTCGSIMRSLTDRFKVSRFRLAMLIHTLAGSFIVIVPISSWAATTVAYIDQSGVDIDPDQPIRILADPFFIYLRSIPFVFYSFLILIVLAFIIYHNISFGSMFEYEKRTVVNHQEFIQPTISTSEAFTGLFIPLTILVGGTLFGFPYAGGYYLFGGQHSFIDSLKYNQNPFLVMLLASLGAVIACIIISTFNKSLSVKKIPLVAWQGFDMMYKAIFMVILATTLSSLLANNVGTGQYLASIMLNSMPVVLLPVMFFLVSLLTTATTGSAWGNIGLMIPIAIPMIVSFSGLPLPIDPIQLPLLYPVLGAILSGSACGEQLSPLSDGTAVTVTSTNITPVEHAITQFPLILPVIVACTVSYLMVGFLATYPTWISIGTSMGVGLIISLVTTGWLNKNKS